MRTAIVEKITGDAFVLRNGAKTPIAQGDEIYRSDTISTGEGSYLELNFDDGTIISLGSGTSVQVRDFVFDPTGATDPAFSLHMMQGLVRSISGKIVEQNPEAFTLSSPLGTVGIRGTITMHEITKEYEVHSVLSIGEGHTVVILGVNGQYIVLTESPESVILLPDTKAALERSHLDAATLQHYVDNFNPEPVTGSGPTPGYLVLSSYPVDGSNISGQDTHVTYIPKHSVQSLIDTLTGAEQRMGAYDGAFRAIFTQGVSNYSSFTGNLIGSMENSSIPGLHYSTSKTTNAPDFFPNIVTPMDQAPVDNTPKAGLTMAQGQYYLASGTVLESDPFGIQGAVALTGSGNGTPLVFDISSGDAVMGTHYADPSQWSITLGDGSIVTNCFIDNGDGTVSLNLPSGVSRFTFKVPLIDDSVSGDNHTFVYTLLSSGGYQVTGNATGTVLIVDDSHANDFGWTPPAPNDPGYLDGSIPGPHGPLVQVSFDDPASSAIVGNAGDQTYNIEFIDPRTGVAADSSLFTEATTITLQIQGQNGLIAGTTASDDFIFDFSSITTAGATYTYDPSTGTLTVNLPAGWSGNAISFTGAPNPANLSNGGSVRPGVSIDVITVEGNEGITGDGSTTEIYTIPTVSVSADVASFDEDNGEVSFTFDLSSALPGSLTVKLDWSGVNTDECTLADGSPLPSSITFGADQTSLTIVVKGKNDTLSQGDKTLSVTIKPENGSTAQTDDSYRIADGTDGKNASAESVRVDDVDGTLDGPQVQLILTDASQTPLADSEISIKENNGTVYYQLKLVNPDGSDYTGQREAIAVTIKVDGDFTGSFNDNFWFTNTTGQNWTYNQTAGTITVTIPAGQNTVSFKGTSKPDKLTESGQQVSLEVESVSGNESSVHEDKSSTTTNIVDVPTISVSTDVAEFSESNGEVTFTFTLTSGPIDALNVGLNWSGLNTSEYTVVGGGNLPNKITFTPGQTTYTVTVRATDDTISQGDKTLSVQIKPENGSSGSVNDNYHVSGSGAGASAVRKDDTEGDGNLDGPKVQLIIGSGNVNQAGNSRYDNAQNSDDARYDGNSDHAIVVEDDATGKGGSITYKVQLVDDGGQLLAAAEDVTVVIQLDLLGGAKYNDDFTFDIQSIPSAYHASFNQTTGKLTLTIPKGTPSIDIPVKIIPDQLTEVGRQPYDDQGNPIGAPLPDEEFVLKIDSVKGGETSIGDHNTVTTTIDEDIQGIQVGIRSLSGGPTNGTEGGSLQFKLTLTDTANEDIIVILKQVNGDGDFTTLKFKIDAGQDHAIIDVPIKNDMLGEGNEPYTLVIDKVIGGEASIDNNRNTVTGTLYDDMNGPVISITADQTEVYESATGTNEPTSASFTVHIDGVPVEPVDVSLTISHKDDATWPSTAEIEAMLPSGVTVVSNNNGVLVVHIPAGYGEGSGGGSFKVSVGIVDDKLTEVDETFNISIGINKNTDAPGSEATIKNGGGSASTTIVDDSLANDNLDGPFLHLEGTLFISESASTNGQFAKYYAVLRDADGNPVVAAQDVTMTVSYRDLAGDGYDGAIPKEDFEVLDKHYTITIRAGQSQSDPVEIRIADDKISENNERFVVEVDQNSVHGNEVRIKDPEDIKVKTVIVDDTKTWPDNTGVNPGDPDYLEVGKDIHGPGQLDGPKISLSGPQWLQEPAYGSADEEMTFTLNLSNMPEQEVIVTICLKPAGVDFFLKDLFGSLSDDEIIAKMEAAGMQNWRQVATGDNSQGWLFEVKVQPGQSSASFSLPLVPDDYSENDMRFTTTIKNVSGSEASIDTNNNSVTTHVTDEPNGGPSISLKVLDYDGGAGENGQWQQNGDFPENYTPGDGYAPNQIHFQISSSRPVVENTEVVFQIYDRNHNPIDKGTVDGATRFVGEDGQVYYKITINANNSSAGFGIPKSGGYEYYQVQVLETHGSETVIQPGQSVSSTEIHHAGESTIPVIGISADQTSTLEGQNANFTITVSRGTVDNAGYEVTLKISGLGSGFTLDDIAGDLFGTPGYEHLQWVDKANGTFKVIVPAGNGSGGFHFTLPIATDSIYEGDEGYMLTVIGSNQSGAYAGGYVTNIIEDNYDKPELSLHQTAPSFAEGGDAEYYLELDAKPTDLVFIRLAFTGGDSDPAENGKDYIAINHPLEIQPGEWRLEDGKYRYYFKVQLPNDEFSNDGLSYKVSIADHSPSLEVGADNSVTTIINDTIDGPSIRFDHVTETAYENNKTPLKFELILERPAVEEVTVTIKISGTTTNGADYDLSSLASRGYSVYEKDGNLYLDVKIPAGRIQTTLDLSGIFINDILTEGDESLILEMVNAKGGEVQINPGQGTATITVKDVLDGETIKVVADKTSINELDAGTSAADVKYTFTLPGAKATQAITITFMLEGTTDNIPKGPYSVTIPVNENSTTWNLPAGLVNDKKDESGQNIVLKITDINGNEALGIGSSVKVDIIDDDHAPVARPDSIIILVPPKPGTNSWTIDVLRNDTDADNDPLRTLAKNGNGTYGSYSINDRGELVYTIDGTNDTVKKLTTGETLEEDNFKFKVSDTDSASNPTESYNPVDSEASLQIKVTTKYASKNENTDEWIMGSDQAEEIDGKGGNDVIHGGGGNDTIHIYTGGKGEYFGDEGNDVFKVRATDNSTIFAKTLGNIHGGTGVDALVLAGSGQTLDFTDWDTNSIDGIEILDITGTGDNTIRINAGSVAKLNNAMDDTSYELRIVGNDGDTLILEDSENWTAKEQVTIGADTFWRIEYTDGTSVLVHESLRLNVSGDTGNDVIDVTSLANQGTGKFIVDGGNGNDTIYGGAGDDILKGGDGDDQLDGRGGKDQLFGGSGNDTLYIHDNTGNATIDKDDIGLLDGGTGMDRLMLGGNGLKLDLVSLQDSIKSIEIIDISGSGSDANHVALNDTAFTKLVQSTTGNTLYITGKAGDTYTLYGSNLGTAGNWSSPTIENIDGVDWIKYTSGGKNLYVNPDMVRIVEGGTGADTLKNALPTDILLGNAGNDTFNLADLTGDGKVSSADFGKIDGGVGTNDAITLQGNGLGLDLSGLGLGTISGVETINLNGVGANHLVLDADTLTDMGFTTSNYLTVQGDTSDTFELLGSGWQYIGVTGSNRIYQDASGHKVYVNSNLANTMYADAAGGTLANQVANDQMYGSLNNDTFVLTDVSGDNKVTGVDFGLMDGSAGSNTLMLGGNNLALDLSNLTTGKIAHIDAIDLTGAGDNKLTLDSNSLSNMGLGNGDSLSVHGDNTDSFELVGNGWTFVENQNHSNIYKDANGRFLSVHEDLTHLIKADATGSSLLHQSASDQLMGDVGNDTLIINDINGDSILDSADFRGITGGAGHDILRLDSENTEMHLGGLGITGIEHFDLAAGCSLYLNAQSLSSLGVTEDILITGDNSVNVFLEGSWEESQVQTEVNGTLYDVYNYQDDLGTHTLLIQASITAAIS